MSHYPKYRRVVWVTVPLTPEVLLALRELESFFGPKLFRVARFFLVLHTVDRNGIDMRKGKSVREWLRGRERHLALRLKGEGLKRVKLSIHHGLARGLTPLAKELRMSRAELVVRILTRAVNERIQEGDPCLEQTLKRLKLPRKKWPWE